MSKQDRYAITSDSFQIILGKKKKRGKENNLFLQFVHSKGLKKKISNREFRRDTCTLRKIWVNISVAPSCVSGSKILFYFETPAAPTQQPIQEVAGGSSGSDYPRRAI